MDDLTGSSIDDLAAQTTIEDYGNIRMVSIPNFSTLSASKRTAVFNKAQQRHVASAEYAENLTSRLMRMTPPLDEEEEIEEARVLEAQARKELEEQGCPPCYPPDLDFPLQNPPDKYQAIIWYWKSFPGTDEVVLCAQRSDWRIFRTRQGSSRAHNRNRVFSNFMNEARERRRRHGVGGDVHLLLDPKQQSRLENWMEFQNYQLKRFEGFKKRRDELKKELDNAQEKAEVSERAAENIEAVQQELEDAERDLERHMVLLPWIEQERRTMDLGNATPAEEDRDDQNALLKRRASTRPLRSLRPDSSAVLGKVRVSKPTPKSRNMRIQTLKGSKSKPIIVESDVTTPSSIQQVPKRRETKPGRAKETPLSQLRPQRVSKAKRVADAGTKSRPGPLRHDAGQTPDRARPQRRLAPQRPLPTPRTVETRSGRISRPPVRWAPE